MADFDLAIIGSGINERVSPGCRAGHSVLVVEMNDLGSAPLASSK
jgi:glycerol-3-phosphate dehydrogenase